MIELLSVRKIFNEGQENAYLAIDDINLHVEANRVTVLTGPSGSGKTTLLTLIGCLARPTSGRVRINGEEVSTLPERFLTTLRRHTFGFIFQRFNLITGLSVLHNVTLPAYPTGQPRDELHHTAMTLLSRLHLTHKANSRVEWLSGGEAQRVAMARALINNPKVIIADEPTANLDTHLSHEFLEIIASLREEGRTVLLTSHDPLITSASVVERRVALRDGRLQDTP